MNDEDFIIISSDEEIDTNTISKKVEISGNAKEKEQTAEHEVGCSNKLCSLLRSKEQETAQDSQLPTVDTSINLSSKNLKHYISTEAKDAPNTKEVLSHAKESMPNDKIKTEIETDVNKNNENDNNVEMSSTFNKFIQLVLSIEKEEGDKLKLLKKLTKYHNLADPKYLKSDELSNLVENAISKLNKDHSCLYEILKEVLDCLLSKRVLFQYRKTHKVKSSGTGGHSSKEKVEEGTENNSDNIYFNVDDKNHKIVKKLCETLRKLEKKIKEVEEAEVDLSDEEDSNYFKMQRYRERFCQVYKKLCEYTNQAVNANRVYTRKITFNGTNNLQLDRAIESWLNKTMQFPDYASVLQFLRESNENLNLGWTKENLKKMAIDVFAKIGKSLQLRRKYDLWESLNSYLGNEVNPSASDESLREKLDANFQAAAKKEKELLNYYAELQVKGSLEPVEVPEEEANCSPVESGDEDENEIEEVERALSSKIPAEVEDDGEESDSEENDQENVNSRLVADEKAKNVESIKSDASTKFECISNCLRKDKNDESSKSGVTGSSMKEQSCEDVKSRDGTGLRVRKFPDVEITQCMKKPKMTETETRDSDSDCEIVVLLSDEETNITSEKGKSCEIRKVHQINYTFISNNFNYNATLTDDIILKRKNSYSSFKVGKNQRRSLPLSDLTNIKHITNKYARMRGGLEKRKVQETIRLRPFEKSRRFRYSQFILPDKMSNHCALQNKSGAENVKSRDESDQVNEKESCEKSSNDDAIGPSNNGGSGGGNGQDNNEDNGNKKPSDQEKATDDVEEIEDEGDDEEDDKDERQKTSTPAESNGKHSVKSNGNEDNECSAMDDSFITPEQLVCVTFDPPQSERKSIIPKPKRSPSNKSRVHKNGGLPCTSKVVPTKYPFSCKPYVGNNKIPRDKPRQSLPVNLSELVQRKKQSTPSRTTKTDEEIVKNFLQHSPSSISITSPRKRIIEKQPSPSILQAIQTLSRLKSITTTVVKASSSERREDVTFIGESPKKIPKRNNNSSPPKSGRSQSFMLPKIVTVQGNVTGFENMDADNAINNFPDNKAPRFKRRKTQRSSTVNSDGPRQVKNTTRQPSKNVEYVVLD